MEEYIQYLQEQGNSTSTIAKKETILSVFKKWLQNTGSSFETLTYPQLLSCMKEMQQRGNKQSSIQKRIGYLKQYLNWLVKNGSIPHNPILAINIQGVKRQHLYNIIEPEELTKIYESYETEQELKPASRKQPPQELNHLARKRNKVILGLIVYQGISVHDLGNIKPQHVQIKKGLITIPAARRINERTLKLEAAQLFELHEYITIIRPELLKERDEETDKLFMTAYRTKDLRGVMDKLQKKLKTTHGNFNSFKQVRASVITNWLKHHNLRKVQYMAGHRYVSSTEKYQRHNVEDLQQILNAQMPTQEE
jgi:site-specific recombinase XerD